MLDYLIQETGKVFHFQGEGRGRLPRSVRSHDMISKHLGLSARRLEALAKAEAEAGHGETALDLYFNATVLYAGAQHIIFETNDEKRYLYAGLRRCYDQVIALAPYRLEHVDIPWNGTIVSGNLHLCPGEGQRRRWSSTCPAATPSRRPGRTPITTRRCSGGCTCSRSTARARRKQPARHPPDGGQLRERHERSPGRSRAAAGNRPEQIGVYSSVSRRTGECALQLRTAACARWPRRSPRWPRTTTCWT